MLSNNPYAKQWDDALRTKFFYKQIGANYKLELIYALLEEDFRYISNSIDSDIEAKNHFSSFEYQHHFNH